MRDFEAYYAAGAAWNAGADPYSQAIWHAEKALPGINPRRYEALPFVAPPAALPVFGLIARLPFPEANVLWRALLVVSMAALALLTLRLAQRKITAASLFAVALAAVGFAPLTSALALGQLVLPAFLFAALASVWRPVGFFAWVQPNVALTMLSQAATRRGASTVAASLAAFAAVCILVVGIPGTEQYLGVLHRHGLAERFSAIQITPASVAYGFGAAPAVAKLIGAAVALAAVCCWVLLMRIARDATARFCATCALLPLAMPFFHEHDLLVAFVPALVYAIRSSARILPLAGFGALLTAADWLGLAQRPDGTLQTVLLVGAFGAALIALQERPRARLLLLPAAALAVIGAAALLVHAHPAPVWPDSMGALPAHVDTMDIERAWNAEQGATGLLAQNALWASLRLLSLLGCTLTAAAIAISSRYPAGSRSPSPVPA